MRTRGVQLNAAVMAQERGASSSSRMRARSPSPPAIPSSSTSTDPDEEEEEEEEVSDELLPEEQDEVFDSQGHSSHGRWRCPEPGFEVLLGANSVQANGVHMQMGQMGANAVQANGATERQCCASKRGKWVPMLCKQMGCRRLPQSSPLSACRADLLTLWQCCCSLSLHTRIQ